jgi:hypothetical protein
MATFSLTQGAHKELQRIANESGHADPVLTLADSSLELELDEDLRRTVLDGLAKMDDESLAKILVQTNLDSTQWRVSVGAFERSDCRPKDIFKLEGLWFAMSVEMRAALSHFAFDFSEGIFFFRREEVVALSLQAAVSIKR